jgi:two-component system chemotaxis response regulator CheY
MKALVTDSSQTVRTRMSRMLMESGFEVSQAKDGAQALAFLSAHPETDLVLTDWQMPSVPGLELTTAIRADAHFDHVRVVTVTMHSDAASVRSAFRAIVDDFIMKPHMKAAAHEKVVGLRFPDVTPATQPPGGDAVAADLVQALQRQFHDARLAIEFQAQRAVMIEQ